MAIVKRDRVTIVVDRSYFEHVFEPGRKRMQNKIGLSNLTQPAYTAMLARAKGIKINTGFKKWKG